MTRRALFPPALLLLAGCSSPVVVTVIACATALVIHAAGIGLVVYVLRWIDQKPTLPWCLLFALALLGAGCATPATPEVVPTPTPIHGDVIAVHYELWFDEDLRVRRFRDQELGVTCYVSGADANIACVHDPCPAATPGGAR